MLKRTHILPKCFEALDRANENWEYYECFKDGQRYGYLALCYPEGGPTAMTHYTQEPGQWTPSICREMKKDWDDVRSWVKNQGYKGIVAPGNPADGILWDKFMKLFGFKEIITIKLASQEV